MPAALPLLPRRPAWLWCALLFGLLACCRASAQEEQSSHVRLDGISPAGVRSTVTDNWGACQIILSNAGDSDSRARILLFYNGRPDEEYGRDVWVPAHATLTTWMLVGPPPPQPKKTSLDVQYLVYRRSAGQDQLIVPHTEKHFRERTLRYRPRQPTTAVLVDLEIPRHKPGDLPQPEAREDEILTLVRAFRYASFLPEPVQILDAGPLPPTAQAFRGIDHFVVASDRLSSDPVGARALRHWLEQGGTVWVMLDQVGPDVVASLLGEALDFQVVDRVSLTTIPLQSEGIGQDIVGPPKEQAVDFVRVLLPAGERSRYTIAGWPVWFTRQIGQGKVIFTTLGPRGWYRPRTGADGLSRYEHFPAMPIPLDALNQLATVLQPNSKDSSPPQESFGPILAQEIGYTVLGPGTVALIFGLFLLAVLVLGLVLRRTRRPELVGWLTPAAALLAGGVFFFLGASSRQVVPPTVAVVQVVDAVPGRAEVPVHGELAVYRPDAGPAVFGTSKGGFFKPDMTGLEGQIRRFLVTDLDRWHWENLELPAGVRDSPFRFTLTTRKPLTAVAHLGPDGLEGKLTAGPFPNPGDALLTTPADRRLALHLQADGSFRAGPADVLLPGQFLQSAVLSDRQQRRQLLYRDLVRDYSAPRRKGDNILLAWADPASMPFDLEPDARLVGSALLAVPLRLEHAAAGQRVTVPSPLIPYWRILAGGQVPPRREGTQGTEMELRFQLPAAVLPLKVESARLVVKINAPSRRVTIAGRDGDKLVELRAVDSPLDPLRVDIAQEALLHLDAKGGLHVNLTVSANAPAAPRGKRKVEADQRWTLEYVELEVRGVCGP
jgi:hypothetical protein